MQRRNWQALGQHDKAAKSKSWAIGSAVAIVVMSLLPLVGVGSDGWDRLVGLALLITWYYANGKEQHAWVLARYGKTYPRRAWWKPLGWAVLVYAAMFLLIMLVVFITR